MNKPYVSVLIVLLSCVTASTQSEQPSPPSAAGYTNSILGFRYRPPTEMLNVTESAKADIRNRAEATHSSDTLGMLLAMWSGTDHEAPGWSALTIETYPRKAFSDLDDTAAEAKLNAWVMGFSKAVAMPKSAVFSGQSFTMSVFEKEENGMKKRAMVLTTIRKSTLVAFAFQANSPEQLKAVADSMKSLQFF